MRTSASMVGRKEWTMRLAWIVALVLTTAGWSVAQDQTTSPEELNRKYQDSLAQLKAAQDRKNELANENERLSGRVADLEKQLDQAKRQAATFAEQTFYLRAERAAWQAFLKRYPTLLELWKSFIASDPLALPGNLPERLDPTNPLGGQSGR
jgi:uncharacterized protein HemX